jgi:outer membrane protein assembly factor BamE (lipoprotein component of BamABCDE complex)
MTFAKVTFRSEWSSQKRFLFRSAGLALICLLAAHMGCQQEADKEHVITTPTGTASPGVGLGDVRLGMTPEQVETILGKPSQTHFTTGKIRGEMRYYDRGVAMLFNEFKGVWRISCLKGDTIDGPYVDYADATIHGVRLGHTRDEIEERMGAPDSITTDQPIVIRYRTGIAFHLQSGYFPDEADLARVIAIVIEAPF